MHPLRTARRWRVSGPFIAVPLILLVSLVPSRADSQTPHLVKDINTTTTGSGSDPWIGRCYPELGFFMLGPDIGDQEPWRTDGTAEGTFFLKNIMPGGSSSILTIYPAPPVNGEYLFAGDDGVHGVDLWTTDGTGPGTVLLKDIAAGSRNSSPSGWALFQGHVFFWATTPASGRELWWSDGTAPGTALFKDLVPGAGSSDGWSLTQLGPSLLFFTSAGLWVSDGTPNGTVLVSPVVGQYLMVAGNTAFFSVPGSAGTVELWRTDGTAAGTKLVKGGFPSGSGQLGIIHSLDGVLIFTADDGAHGPEPWRSDGTPDGTYMLDDINPGPDGSSPLGMARVGAKEFFQAYDPTHGTELWSTDGTVAGTGLVADICPGSCSSRPYGNGVVGSTVIFGANDWVHGLEVWKSDGTAGGTVMVKDLNPGPASSVSRMSFRTMDGFVLFPADDGIVGSELWRTDGTDQGTVLVKNIKPDIANSSTPRALTSVGDEVVFDAWNGSAYQLWSSDGSEAGTRALAEIPGGGLIYDGLSASAAGLAFVVTGEPSDPQLWRTDGTAGGTFSLAAELRDPATIAGSPDLLFFVGSDADHGEELWTTDGTEAGTGIVEDLDPGPSGSLGYGQSLSFANGLLFFTPAAGIPLSFTLYVSNGTPAGTRPLAESINGGAGFTAVGNEVYFVEGSENGGFNLWRTDGSPSGTVLAHYFPDLDSPRLVAAAGRRAFFYTNNQLWVSDGTEAGTRFLADIPGSWLDFSRRFAELNGQLFFMFRTFAPTTYQLWRSDGTPAGTHPIVDFAHPPAYVANTPTLVAAGGHLYFEGWDDAHGVELWKTDGTAAGTSMAADIVPGPGSSSPEALKLVGNTLYFRATTPETGTELWAMTVPDVGNSRRVSLAIGSSNQLSPFGKPVTITVTVQAVAGTPTGTVRLNDGDVELATLSLVASGPTLATATYTTDGLDIGDHELLAQYNGDGGHDGGQSLPTVQSIVPASTAVSLAASPNPADAGQAVSLTATVATGLTTPAQGTVTFRDAASGVIGTVALDTTGSASLSMAQVSGGTHFLSAEYSGETRFQPGTSPVYRLGVRGTGSCPAFTSLGDYRWIEWSEDNPLVYTADLNRDGRADVVAPDPRSYTVGIGEADAEGRLTASIYPNVGPFKDVVLGNFGGGDALDIGIASLTGLVVLVNEGDSFRAVWDEDAPDVTGTTAADFNNDGKLDIAFIDGNYGRIGFGDGNAGFSFGPQFPLGGYITAGRVAAADVNRDGTPDLVAAQLGTGWVATLLADGDGGFGAPTYTDTGDASVSSIAVADLDDDGRLDVVAIGNTDHDAVVLLGNGDGTFRTGAHYPFGQQSVTPEKVLLGDLDGDTIPDLVSVPDGEAPGDIEIRLGDGDGTFGEPKPIATYEYVGAAALGDVNGDGKLDLVVRSKSGDPLDVLFNACGPLPTNTNISATPTTIAAGQGVDLVATVTAASGQPAGRVTFRDAGEMVAQADIGPQGRAQTTLSTLPTGTHSITARYTGSGDYWHSESAPVTVTVQTNGPPPAPATSRGRATARALPVGTAATDSPAAAHLEGGEARQDAAGIPILSPIGLALLLVLIALTGVLLLRQRIGV